MNRRKFLEVYTQLPKVQRYSIVVVVRTTSLYDAAATHRRLPEQATDASHNE